ncbi:MAG: hypothetical protein WCN87_03555 [Chlamydiota bacterium]
MARQIIWLGAIAFLLLASGFYGISALQQVFFIWQLDGQTEAVVKEWHAKEGESGYYYPYAYFTYKVGSKTYEGSSFYQEAYARNPYALGPILEEISLHKQTAYYRIKAPETVALEKIFPYKLFAKTIVMLTLALYFVFLKKRQAQKALKK